MAWARANTTAQAFGPDMSGSGTEETINRAAGMAAYCGKAAVSLDRQIVSRWPMVLIKSASRGLCYLLGL